MKEFEEFKKQVLEGSERLGPDDSFSFSCHPGLSCFNKCCGDVNIFLTPYDVLRLKKRLGLSSAEVLSRYTLKPFSKDQKLPVVMLRMDESKENKPCPLVTDKGCSVYEDRPWPCRMYPVGVASARTAQDQDAPEFYFLMREQPCDGFDEGQSWTIRAWIENQGAAEYDAFGDLFKEVTLHPRLRARDLNPQQMEMYYTACYDLDRFRGFVFESSFLERYEVEAEVLDAIRDDEEELLKFAFRWLRTCLFGDNLIPLKAETIEKYRERLAAQGAKLDR